MGGWGKQAVARIQDDKERSITQQAALSSCLSHTLKSASNGSQEDAVRCKQEKQNILLAQGKRCDNRHLHPARPVSQSPTCVRSGHGGISGVEFAGLREVKCADHGSSPPCFPFVYFFSKPFFAHQHRLKKARRCRLSQPASAGPLSTTEYTSQIRG